MLEFVVLSLLLVVITVLLLLLPFLGAQRAEASRAARDAAIYRDQLAEVDRDVARGTLTEAESVGTRAEISRRLIAATARADADRGSEQALAGRAAGGPRLALALVALVPAAGVAVYLAVGSPSLPDRPFAARPAAEQRAALMGIEGAPRMSQAEAEARFEQTRSVPEPSSPADEHYAEQVRRLEEILQERPDDIQGRQILATSYMRQQRFSEAAAIHAELARLLGPRASADIFANRVEALVLAAGGYVSPEAEDVIRQTLALDDRHPMGRYYTGLALAQRGEAQRAIVVWEQLRSEATPEDAWGPLVDQMISRARAAMGPASGPGPSTSDIAGAEAMSDEERGAMIRSMVAQLEERLMSEGGLPEEWVRLINAYSVLGEAAEARRIYVLSQQALSGSEAGFVREQALVMGVISQ